MGGSKELFFSYRKSYLTFSLGSRQTHMETETKRSFSAGSFIFVFCGQFIVIGGHHSHYQFGYIQSETGSRIFIPNNPAK